MGPDIIGWTAGAILLATIGRQVYTQWRDESFKGVSHWLFIGQMAASTGFIVYSWLVHNWVFVAVNVLMLATAVLGQFIYRRNKRIAARQTQAYPRLTPALRHGYQGPARQEPVPCPRPPPSRT